MNTFLLLIAEKTKINKRGRELPIFFIFSLNLFKNGPTPASFLFIFVIFKPKLYNEN